MAILYRHWDPIGKSVNNALRAMGIPHTWKDEISFDDNQDTVKLLPFHSSKGLEFPIVAIPGVGEYAGHEEDAEEARLLYVAMTRATKELVVLGSSMGAA